MTGATDAANKVTGRILSEHVIPAREFYGLKMTKGQILRIIDLEGQQVMDYMAFNAQDPAEKQSMVWTNVMNRTWKIIKGHVLYSNRAAPMFKLLEDTVGMNYTGGGYCTEYGNFVRYGVRGTRNCGDNLENALAPFGVRRRDMDEAANFNIFMNVAYDTDGTFEIGRASCRERVYVLV